MGISEITSREPVLQAIKEFDQLGREQFLETHNFGKANKYMLEYKGRYYDSKAIIGVAYKYAVDGALPLGTKELYGGEQVKKRLESLGFKVATVAKNKTWIFQSSPDYFEIRKYLEESLAKQQEITWKVSHFADKIIKGDNVFIWQAKGKSKNAEPSGIVALCKVVSAVGNIEEDALSKTLWKPNHEQSSEDTKRVRLEIKMLASTSQILTSDYLKNAEDAKTLRNMSIIKSPQGTNFKVNHEDAALLHHLWNLSICPLETDYYKTIESQAQDNENRSLDEIEQRYEANRKNNETSSTTTTIRVFKRNQDVVDIRKRRANYQCEVLGCTNKPFKTATNKWYCEVHHIIPLSEDGLDCPENTACLCPTHHKEIHYGKNADQLKEQLQQLRDNEKEPS